MFRSIKSLVAAFFAALALGLLALPASATGVTGATTVLLMTVTNYGVIVFTVNGAITGTPSCNTGNRFAIDTTSTATNSKAMVEALMLAVTAGKTVVAVGTGTCTIDGNSENLHDIEVYQ